MMREDFLKQINAYPDDTTARLIYADYLEEQNDPRAEFIRAQCQLADLAGYEPEAWPLRLREDELLDEYREEWLREAGLTARHEEWRFSFARGFVEVARFPRNGAQSRAWMRTVQTLSSLTFAHADGFLQAGFRDELQRLRRLVINEYAPASLRGLQSYFNLPALAKLEHLTLQHMTGKESFHLALLRDATFWPNLRELHLNSGLAADVTQFMSLLPLERLRRLSLVTSAPSRVRLKQVPWATTLEHLTVDSSHFRAFLAMELPALRGFTLIGSLDKKLGVQEFLRAGFLPQLEQLEFSGGQFSPTEGQELLGLLGRPLRRLSLYDCGIDERAMQCLADSDIDGITELNLAKNKIGDEGVRCIVESPVFQELRYLDLASTGISGRGLRMLLASPNAQNLVVLRLPYNGFGDGDLQEMVACAGLQQLQDLNIQGNKATPETYALLKQRFGEHCWA